MNLKDFSLVSPVTHVGEVLRAIEAAIPPEAIERAIAETSSQECRTRSLPAHLVVCQGNCDEFVVKGLDARRTQELD